MTIDRNLVSDSISPLVFDDDELTSFIEALHRPPKPAIRLRSDVEVDTSSLPFPTEPVPWYRHGRFISGNARPGASIQFAAGEFYIQDAASLLAIAVLDPQKGEVICDLCAAPGGKSTAILETLNGSGWLLANEAVKSRTGSLEFNLARHGLQRYIVSSWDPDELARLLASTFDAVLVDAPCSGQSLVGRGKQTASSFAASTVDHCSARQTRILDAAASLVRVGGRLVYSTCTFAYAENEGQVVSFLQRHPGWEEQPVSAVFADSAGMAQSGIGVRLWPHRHGSAGGFAACLRRMTDANEELTSRSRFREPQLRPANLPANFNEWGKLRDVVVYQNGLQCFGWPTDVPSQLTSVGVGGPEITFRKANTWFPSYALAMRRDENWSPKQVVQVDDQQAKMYLQGHPLTGELVGWGVTTWSGHPLGWVKGDGRHMKNHLPKAGRLR